MLALSVRVRIVVIVSIRRKNGEALMALISHLLSCWIIVALGASTAIQNMLQFLLRGLPFSRLLRLHVEYLGTK